MVSSLLSGDHEGHEEHEDHEEETPCTKWFSSCPSCSSCASWFPALFESSVQSAAVSTIGDGLRIILWRSAPAGTIGYTESSCSTWKSISAVRFRRRAASTAPWT